MATVSEQIQQIYIGLLGRAADQAGLDYWTAEIEGGVLTIEQLRANIVNEQAEYAAGQGSMTRAQAVADLYENLFNRAPEADGLEYWVNGAGSSVNLDQLVLALIDGASAADQLVLDNKTDAAEYYTEQAGDAYTADAAEAAVADVDATQASVDASKTATDSGSQSSGQTFTLTTGVDKGLNFIGGDANDTFISDHDITNDVATLGALDVLDGGAGTDTLEITSDDNAAYEMAAATISNIEKITIAGALGVTADVSGANVTGLESLAVTKATAATLTADSSTAVNVSGVSGITKTTGGASVTVNQDTSAGVNTTAADVASIVVNKAKDVDVTVTNSEANVSAGTNDDLGIVVGDSAANAATGAVTISATGADTDGDDATLDAITVTGGTTVSVTQTASADMTKAEADLDGATHTLGAVKVTAGDATTSVTVVQDQEVGETNAKVAKAGVVEQQTVKFVALDKGESVTIDGLTFTASADLTAAQVAEAFAGLTKGGDLQDAGGPIANGIYTGSLDANWVSGEANGDTVVFSQAVAGTGTFDGNTDTAAAGNITVTKTQTAVAAVAGVTGVLGVVNGTVTIDDNATASITDIVVDGYGAGATLGNTGSLDALENLTLKNSDTGTATVKTTQTALNLTVEDVDNNVTVSNTVKDLTLTAENVASDFALNTTAVENATITANADLTLGGTALAGGSTSVKTVTVNGSGEVDLGDISTNTGLNSFNASANTGGVSATIATKDATLTGTITEYVFSAGDDSITLDETNIDVKVTAGAGDDEVILADGTTAAAKAVDGGTGEDKLQMLTANAVTASQNATFAGQVTNFETLVLRDSTGAQEVEADVLGNYNKVEILNAQAGSATTLDGLTSGATIILNDNSNVETIVAMTDADTNSADVLNIEIGASDEDGTADANGVVRADDVQTINIDVSDISTVQTPKDTAADAQSLTLNAQDATTINVTGDTDLTLSTSLNQKVTAINASTFTGNLTVTAAGGVATTITGGSGDDNLTASTGAAAGTANATGTAATLLEDGAGTTKVGAGEKFDVDFSASDLAEGESITIAGLTLTLNDDGDVETVTISAADVAAAFANLTAGATAGNVPTLTGNTNSPSVNTEFTWSGTLTGFNTGAVTATDNVLFTSTTDGDVSLPTGATGATAVTVDTNTAAVLDTVTLDVTAEFNGTTDLDQGDSISLTVEGTKYTYTVTDTTESIDSANAELLALIEANAKVSTDSTYDAANDLFTFVSEAGDTDIDLAVGTDYTVTDAAGGKKAGDIINGGAGDDTITGGDLAQLTGGEGNDTFVVNIPTNVNSYSTITDLSAGDVIQLTATETFVSSAVTLASTAVFQDYANAAVNQLATDDQDAAWFQFGGNTFIVINDSQADAADADFENGADAIIQITGLVDLSTASYNQTQGTLEIA